MWMSRLFVLALVGILLGTIFFTFKSESPGEPTVDSHVLSQDSSSGVLWRKVDANAMVLIPNFEAKKTSKSAFEENGCETLINGGFYGRDNAPIGYFVADGQELSGFRQNKLFDGVLSVNEFGTPRITRKAPSDPLVSAVQTGPIVFENGLKVPLSIMRDRPDRRMLAAVTGVNELIFITFYSPESSFSGPRLAELPDAISKLNEAEELNIADAVNLDGGSASAFITAEISLTEASPVGSFFCVKKAPLHAPDK
jgi:uncharacterized protein YigE (DUF2233 family)